MSWDVLLLVGAAGLATRLRWHERVALVVTLALVATPFVLFVTFVLKP